MRIRRLQDADVDAVVAFAVEAWAPVFASLEDAMGAAIFARVYPDWRATQAAAVAETVRAHESWVAVDRDRPVGFVAAERIEEGAARAVEIHMVAVDPAHQGAGVGALLCEHALAAMADGDFAVVATGGDPGHAPARALYEKLGFKPLPLVRYYRER